MSGPAPFEPYRGWQGSARTTMAESTPSWPERPAARPGSPNVIVVLADDLGFSDVGCFGSEIPTPHLDRTAADGLRYTNFRVTPLCSPTRAALMTGLNAHAAGIGFPTQIDPGFPGYVSELPLDQPVLPEVFRANGYATLMVGKWHLCREDDFSEAGSRHNWPLQRGFDQFYGFLEALTDFHHPHRLYEGNSVVHVDEYPDGYYLTDDLTDRAERMIREVRAADADKPFFLYFSHGAVHAPMHARAEDIARHRGRYDDGWDVVRERRLARQVELGVMPPGTELPPRNCEAGHDVRPWDELNATERAVHARHMEVYAAMVESLDRSVGRLRALLADLGELDNTVIVFSSDNGAARLTDQARPLPSWASSADTGTATYFGYMQTPGVVPAVDEELPQHLDRLGGPTTWPHYPRGWAMACNTPFRLYKFSTLRGGQQSPFILSWPAGIEQRGAVLRRQYAHITDVLPTLVELIGLDLPTAREGRAAAALAGTSLVATIADPDAPSGHREQYTECVGNRGFYRDGWEAATHRQPGVAFSEEHWQLFAPDDPTQRRDVADEHPAKVAELREAFDAAAWANQVFPLDEGSGLKHIQHPPRPAPRPLRILAGTPTLERHHASLLIQGTRWSVDVDWDFVPGDEGVVLAHGGQAGGYQLWVEDGALWFEQNQYGDPHRFGPVPLDRPSSALELQVEVTGGRWTVTLLVDGTERLVARDLVRFLSFLPFEGIDVGICRRSPVSWELHQRRRTFPFTGTLRSVTYRPDPDSWEQLAARAEQARELGLGLQ
ncbi:arylsulfatase [Nocardioides sp. SLBN-35]|uniref:arylsulfatase n=1 Tax=Nocardioides sp. SLBN-35 TaxID=2768445 RepID=UPI0011548AA0|nr:arylsulfatase [Nocardioides sp. SLBN-35]TQK69498.1 arylsulfatase [Nocardioides sp. SLBN-35]